MGASPPPGFLIRDYLGWLYGLHKLSITVIHHYKHIRLDGFDEGDQLAYAGNGQSRTCLITLGSLDGDKLRLLMDG